MTRILLADDHPMMGSALEMLLAGSDYQFVGRAQSGEQALELVESLNPDIVLLDVNMPRGSGLEVLDRLRKAGARQKVILLTAGMSDYELSVAHHLQPEGIVYKTSDPALLIRCLDEIKAGRRWVDPDVQDQIDANLAAGPSGFNFSPRERELIQLVARGLRNRDIAGRLGITEGTVKVYFHSIFEKAGVSSRTELALKAPQILSSVPDRNSRG